MAKKSSNKTSTSQEEKKIAAKDAPTPLQLIQVSDEERDAARGGRGHGEYDNFVDAFLAANIRGTEVGFDGVKSNSIKTGLKSAIERAVKDEKVLEGELQVRGKDEKVYLVRVARAEA